MNADETVCANCDGEQWVCENHPEVPWRQGDGCSCGGAGMPCVCNPGYAMIKESNCDA